MLQLSAPLARSLALQNKRADKQGPPPAREHVCVPPRGFPAFLIRLDSSLRLPSRRCLQRSLAHTYSAPLCIIFANVSRKEPLWRQVAAFLRRRVRPTNKRHNNAGRELRPFGFLFCVRRELSPRGASDLSLAAPFRQIRALQTDGLDRGTHPGCA